MSARPTISVVTPSLNQGRYLEACIRSVLDQHYDGLEYIVIDGRSTDGSLEIIRKYATRFSYWTSEPDAGHYDAVNKGFTRSTGEIMAWLNSDDMYLPGCLPVVAGIFAAHPEVEWLTSIHPVHWTDAGETCWVGHAPGFNREFFFRGGNLGADDLYSRGWIQQESTFWRRSLWDRAGARLSTEYFLAADFDLWARFYKSAELYGVDSLLGGFRLQSQQRSHTHRERYIAEARHILAAHGGRQYGTAGRLARRYLLPRVEPILRRSKTALRLGVAYRTNLITYTGRDGSWELSNGIVY